MDRLVREMGLETRLIPGNRMGLVFRGRVVASGRPETYPSASRSPGGRGCPSCGPASGSGRRPRSTSAPPASAPVRRRPPGGPACSPTGTTRPSPPTWVISIRTWRRSSGPSPSGSRPSPSRSRPAAAPRLFALVWGDDKTGSARNLIGGSELLPQALAHRLGDRVLTGAAVEEVEPHADGVRVRFVRQGVSDARSRPTTRSSPRRLRDAPDRQGPAAGYGGGPRRDPVRPVRLRRLPHRGGRGPCRGTTSTPSRWSTSRSTCCSTTRTRSGRRPSGSPAGASWSTRAGTRAGSLLALSNDEIRALFLRDLHDVLPATRGIVREVLIQRWEHAIPYAPPGRARIQAALSRPLGRVFLAGDYLEFPGDGSGRRDRPRGGSRDSPPTRRGLTAAARIAPGPDQSSASDETRSDGGSGCPSRTR